MTGVNVIDMYRLISFVIFGKSYYPSQTYLCKAFLENSALYT